MPAHEEPSASVSLVVDGAAVSVRAGATLLDACRNLGIEVPTLCHLQGVTEASACRICVVEVRGLPRPVPACSTPAMEGMVVTTGSEELLAHRRSTVALLLWSGQHVCAFCSASGRCELQSLARSLGVVQHDPGAAPRRPVDASRARFALDPGRCILCTRCVRVCAELEGARTLHLVGRGARTRLATDGGDRWRDSPSCTDCARCVGACPTGALLEKATAAQGLPPRTPVSPPRRAARPAPTAIAAAARARVATAWLGGCSGCHMSLLDLDEELLALAERMDLVESPLADPGGPPGEVDVCLVEGAVSSEDHVEALRDLRARARVLVALGDCACCGNVAAMRDGVGGAAGVLRRAGRLGPGACPLGPELPPLLHEVMPLHRVVPVDLAVPGCPPAPSLIGEALSALLDAAAPGGGCAGGER